MPYAIDLNKRQSARTLEQAIRHHAEVMLEARIWPDAEPVTCRLVETPSKESSRTPRLKSLVLTYCANIDDSQPTETSETSNLQEQAERLSQLVGSYCDLFIYLGEQVYLCSGDIISVEKPTAEHPAIRLHVSWPQTIQVAQRRQFRRTIVADSARVTLYWTRDDQSTNEAVAWLCNVSPNGLACRADKHVVDLLWIGDEIRVEFTLTPHDPERLTMDAVVCNKTPAGTSGKMIIGMQYLTGPGHEATSLSIETLRRRLRSWNLLTSQANNPEGL